MIRMLMISLALLTLTTSSNAKTPKANPCQAIALEWPGAGTDFVHIMGCKLGASLTVVQAGKLKFSLLSLESEEGGAYFATMGKLRWNNKKKRVELPFTAIEEAPEYSSEAKAVLYFDGKAWRVGCDQKLCEVLR